MRMTIKIKKLIAHDIDPKEPNCIPSTQLIDLSNMPAPVMKFFKDHISTSLLDTRTKTCFFVEEEGTMLQQVVNLAKSLSVNKFIEQTSKMATRLHDVMANSTSRSAGTVIFAQYEQELADTEFLAVIKMDPNQGIQYDRTRYEFKIQSDMLPGVNEKLHKCAFIKLDENIFEQDVHLYVLDKQKRDDTTTKYFMNTYLQAKEVINDRLNTEMVRTKLIEMADRGDFGTDVPVMEFKAKVEKAMVNQSSFNVDHDVNEIIMPYIKGENNRTEVIERFKSELRADDEKVQFQFTVDKKEKKLTYVNKEYNIKFDFPENLMQRVVFVMDGGMENGEKVTLIKLVGAELELKNNNRR
jgi:hypothetical protein